MPNNQYRFGEFDLGGLFGPPSCDVGNRGVSRAAPEALTSARLALSVLPETANASSFSALMDELEERFLARSNSTGSDGVIRTVIVYLFAEKRPLLEETLGRHGYRIKDETTL